MFRQISAFVTRRPTYLTIIENLYRLLLHSVPRIVALIMMLANTGEHAYDGFFQLKSYFNVHALFFLISTVKELTQPTKHANKNLVSIFLTMKATILDTRGMSCQLHVFFISDWPPSCSEYN